jgi:hypothetical protein
MGGNIMVKKKKEPELTEEEKIEQKLRGELEDLNKIMFLIPDPTMFYIIGEEVRYGNLKNIYIEEILENGKIYKIDFTSIDGNYGHPIYHYHCKRYIKWLDIRKINQNKESLIKNEDLRLSYSQRTLEDILGKAYYFGIDFEPEYQRDYVWELEDKVALIDSIYNFVDIGKFVFIHNGYSVKYLYQILDGKQRIRAILDFYENRFQYQGKYFSDLSRRDQNHLREYPVSEAEVRDITQEQILRYFLKLNVSGKVMAKEQIEKVRKLLEDIQTS